METFYVSLQNICSYQKQAVPTVIALGNFDGLHIGHCRVILQAAAIARKYGLPLSVMSFTPHPKIVLSRGEAKFHELMPLSEKEEKLNLLGVDRFYLINFDQEVAKLSPEQFAQQFLVDLGVVHAVAGFDFTYGYRGEGNIDRLHQDSAGRMQVTKVQKITYKEEKISSTSIRNRLLSGKVQEVPNFLGHFYSMKCNWNGFSLQPLPHYTVPAPGVYEVAYRKGNEEITGQIKITQNGILECIQPIPNYLDGELSVIWKSCINQSKQPIASSLVHGPAGYSR